MNVLVGPAARREASAAEVVERFRWLVRLRWPPSSPRTVCTGSCSPGAITCRGSHGRSRAGPPCHLCSPVLVRLCLVRAGAVL